jgi:hypothetical protein
VIEPNWILLFSKKRGRWWVRLLACGRYHHVKAIAYLPAMHAWLFYDVKFNGTRLMLIREDDPGSRAFLHYYLDSCDLVAMPQLPIPRRVAPQAGFWCTLAIKHLVGIRAAALRPDQLWRDSIAAGGKPYEGKAAEGPSVAAASMELPKGPRAFDCVLTFMKAHAERSSNTSNPRSYLDDAAFGRQRSELIASFRARIRALLDKVRTGGRRGRPYCPASSRP